MSHTGNVISLLNSQPKRNKTLTSIDCNLYISKFDIVAFNMSVHMKTNEKVMLQVLVFSEDVNTVIIFTSFKLSYRV